MSAPMHLVQMRLDPAALIRFAADQRLAAHNDEDGGYVLHAWLTAMFGAAAPKPFRWIERKGEVLGYAGHDAATLLEHAKAFASPLAYAALQPSTLLTKQMPDTWRTDHRLAVEVLACPISRMGKTEKDVFLRELDRHGEAAPSREAAYLAWFERQWGEAVHVERVELRGFERGRVLRRGKAGDGRVQRAFERPRALFAGVIRVRDPGAFADCLARGIGRHRAFGFGMVLLSPAS